MKDNKLVVIDYMRFVAILSIVAWHCSLCPYQSWELLDIKALPIYYPFKVLSTVFFPDATMPLFTFISGYLFSYLIGQGKYKDFFSFVINKVNRLIIPFIIIGTLVTLTSYDRYIVDIPWGEGSHLWYCCMLFWCFVISWIVVKYSHQKYLLLLLMASFMLQMGVENHFKMGFKLPLGIHHSLYYMGYFIAGFWVFKNKKYVDTLHKYLWYFVILYFFACIISMMDIYFVSKLFRILHCYMYSVLLLIVFDTIIIRNTKISLMIETVCKLSFGIYVFHEWISWNLCHVSVVTDFLRIHYIFFPIANFASIFIMSYILTYLFIKTKIGRYLLL